MPEFVPILTIAIVCMLVLILAFGGVIDISGPSAAHYYGNETNPDRIYLGQNFSVADFRMGTEYASMKGTVSYGMLSKEVKSMSFDARTLDRAEYGLLTLKVNDTNLYGSLIVTINDNVIYNEPAITGTYAIKFNKTILLDSGNKLVIMPSGSGWRIWAPTVYVFEAKISGETKDARKQTTSFKLDSVPATAKLKVYIDSREGDGDMIVKINGYRVFKGRSAAFKNFDPFILREGTNHAEIAAEYGSRYYVDSVYIELD